MNGGSYLADLRGASRSHFVATTVDLLTTGVDVPVVRNVVFFKYVRSPIAFHQMVGRGTRLDPASSKLMFRVYDYTNATRLFGEEFITPLATPSKDGPDAEPPSETERTLVVEGFEVRVSDAGQYIVANVDGRAMPVTVEEYRERLAAKLVDEAPTIDDFRGIWVDAPRRRELIDHLPEGGRSALVIQQLDGRSDYDLFDVLADLGYGQAPKRRVERAEAFGYKYAKWLESLPPKTGAALRALAAQFSRAGTDGLESPSVFQTPELSRAGGLAALKALGKPADVLRETKVRLFAA